MTLFFRGCKEKRYKTKTFVWLWRHTPAKWVTDSNSCSTELNFNEKLISNRRVFPPSIKLLDGWPYFILRILRLVRTRGMDILELSSSIGHPSPYCWDFPHHQFTLGLSGLEPTTFPSGEAAGSLAPLNARPHLLRQNQVIIHVHCYIEKSVNHVYHGSGQTTHDVWRL